MIFGWSVEQTLKFLVALVTLVLAIVGLFVALKPGFDEAVVVLAGEIVGTAGVFMAKNITEDDVSKALAKLQGSIITVVGFFVVLDPTDVEKATVIGGALASVIAVYFVQNKSMPPPVLAPSGGRLSGSS